MPPLVQAYCDDLLVIAHSLPHFLEYGAAIAQYLADMGMSLNVGKCAYAPTTRVPSIMAHVDPSNAVTRLVWLMAKSTVPYFGLKLDPEGMASMKEKFVLRCEALLGWCNNTVGSASAPHEVMAGVVGGIVQYAVPYLLDTSEEVVRLNGAIKAANVAKDLSNVVVRCGKGLALADIFGSCAVTPW